MSSACRYEELSQFSIREIVELSQFSMREIGELSQSSMKEITGGEGPPVSKDQSVFSVQV